MKLFSFFLLIFTFPTILFAQQKAVHPRSLIKAAAVPELREKLQSSPFKEWVEYYEKDTKAKARAVKGADDPYDAKYLMLQQASMYLFTGKQQWADRAWENAEALMDRSDIWNNPISRGLNRATLLQVMALTYDFCYDGWSEAQREKANSELFEVMLSVNSNMGHEANYHLESNWMGVRFGAVLLASFVHDLPKGHEGKAPAKVFEWDATKRLREHIRLNTYENGWNGESVGYFHYNWQFVGPALITLMNNVESIGFGYMAHKATNSLRAYATTAIPIVAEGALGLKPDLSDDHLALFPLPRLAMGMAIFPQEQHPYLKWMHDLYDDPQYDMNGRGELLYSILFYRTDVAAQNPERAGWRTYHDPDQGIALFRKSFQNSEDILFVYTATETRVRGHSGPDTNTFRLLGLGAPWIIGGGRTGQTAGQTNLFPAKAETPFKGTGKEGKMHFHHFDGNGGGYAQGSGSCMKVDGHLRFVAVDYSAETGAAGAFIVADSSQNGRRWRLVTPEFMEISTTDSTFLLTAPNGATLKGTVFGAPRPLQTETGTVRYGGDTQRLNFGIPYQGRLYESSKFLDIFCEGNITVVMTLQPKDAPHPAIERQPVKDAYVVGERTLLIRKEE